MSRNVSKRPDGRYDVYHMVTGEYLGAFTGEVAATRAYVKGTSVEKMTEDMLAQGLITDDEGNVLKP